MKLYYKKYQIYETKGTVIMATLSKEHVEVLNQAKAVVEEVKKVIVGKDDIIVSVLIAILSKGHILLEDNPGVGKTTLALAFSKALSLDYKRVQFTPDVLPSDITGFSVFNKAKGTFEYSEGAALCNLLLADEINRTSSKTQAALLEAMEEGKVTVDGTTRALPDPFFVIATQNPIGSVGTQMLPESQLDRFLERLSMGYPSQQSEVDMLRARQNENPLDSVNAVMTRQELINAQNVAENIHVADSILEYITKLADETRNNKLIKLGLSPRGSLALCRAAKSTALLAGRGYVTPDDVKYVFHSVSVHRIILSTNARAGGMRAEDVLSSVIDSVPVPRVQKD